MPRISGFFCDNVAIDFGTVNTLAAVKGKGVVYREPTAVAVSCGTHRNVLAAGEDTFAVLRCAPGSAAAMYPLREGAVADRRLAEAALRRVIGRCMGRRLPGVGVRAVVCVPASATEMERRAVEEAVRAAGAREAYLLEEPLAAAFGAALPVLGQKGCMIADIGGGTTNTAVLALGGVVTAHSVKCGGVHMDEAVAEYARRRYGLAVGSAMAERAKLAVGCALPGMTGGFELQGRDMKSGLPRAQQIFAGEVYEALQAPLAKIYGAVQQTLENTPPELAGDLLENGIVLTGGGARLAGLREAVARRTRLRVRVAEAPMDCAVQGALLAAERLNLFHGKKMPAV